MTKLIIFDCDGVLVDSEIIANRIDAEMLTHFGYPISPEESIRKFTGMNATTVRNIIFEESGLLLPENLPELINQSILQALEDELQPLMKEVLAHPLLSTVEKCIASSSPRSRILRSLEITNQAQYFNKSHIFTSSQVKKGKPAPDLFLFASEQMGYQAKDCLVVEDSLPGIQAARAAGMEVIGFLSGSHTHYAWYQDSIKKQTLSIASNAAELLKELSRFIII